MPPTRGLFCIHGTFGSPLEYQELQRFFEQQGLSTLAISLPGHGDYRHQPLSDITAEGILDHAVLEFHRFSQTVEEVYLVGHSLGALLALVIAGSQPSALRGVVSLASPYERGYWVNDPMALLELPVQSLPKALLYATQSFTGLPVPQFYPWWYPNLQQQANILFRALKNRLGHITVPVYLFHSPYDVIVPYKEMTKISNAITRCRDIRCHTLSDCGHQIFPASDERQTVIQLMNDWLQSLIKITT